MMIKKDFKRFISSIVFLLLVFVLCGCAPQATITQIELGEGLPVWKLSEPRYEGKLPDNAKEMGLVNIYSTDTDHADLYVYHCPKEANETLQSYGEKLASEHQVFCNMMKKEDCPVAVVNYFELLGDEAYIVQANIFEAKDHFVKVDVMYKTQRIPLANSDLTIRMIKGYEEKNMQGSMLPFEKTYSFENDYLPLLTIRQFPKNYFASDAPVLDCGGIFPKNQVGEFPGEELTLENLIALYQESFDLKKADLMHRNDLDFAFIGYIDDGIFHVKVFIDHGEDMIMLDVEDVAEDFQHITTALIDSIGK